MHGEDQDRRARIVQTKPADERKPAERPGPHSQIDNDQVGLVGAIETKTVGEALRLDDLLDARVFEQLAAALQHDRMVIDDKDARHDSAPTNSDLRARSLAARSTGISM
jgi:hypothetical protein